MPTNPEDLPAAPVDLGALPGSGGVVWSASPEGVHVNLVVLAAAEAIDAHRNDAVDVLVVVLAGAVTVTVDETTFVLTDAQAVEIARGAERRIEAGAEGARYLTIHRERSGMSIGRRDA